MRKNLTLYNLCEKVISQSEILKHLENLFSHLSSRLRMPMNFIQIINGNETFGENLNFINHVINEKTDNGKKTIDDDIMSSIWIDFEQFEQSKKKSEIKSCEVNLFNSIIITGDLFKLYFEYGQAVDGNIFNNKCFTLISNVHEKSIWHEVSHMLGTDDHYDALTKQTKKNCSDPQNCIMQYDPLKFNCFCDASINEIKKVFCENF